MAVLQQQLAATGRLDLTPWSADGSNVRTHRSAAGEPPDHVLGRSRGGRGTKLHLVTDATGLPLAMLASPGQRQEALHAEALLDAVRIVQPSGQRRSRPERLAGDCGCSHRRIRRWLRARHIQAVIPERRDQIAQNRGRAPAFDAAQYRRRNAVERTIGWLKQARAVVTRYDKPAV